MTNFLARFFICLYIATGVIGLVVFVIWLAVGTFGSAS